MIFEYKDEEPVRHILFFNNKNEKIEHVIVFMCGKGQKGTNIDDLFETGLPKILRENVGFVLPNTVVMCCQLPSSSAWVWNDDSIASNIMEYVRTTYTDCKYHFTGLSLGGQGVLYMAEHYAVDSIGVMAGFTWTKPNELAPNLQNIPTYFAHGKNDTVVNKSVYGIIAKLGYDADCEFHELDAGHNVWNWAYRIDNPEGYLNWFRDKFLSNGTNTPDDAKEFIPVDLNALKQGDIVISPKGDNYMVIGISDDLLMVGFRANTIDENWKVRNPNYQP